MPVDSPASISPDSLPRIAAVGFLNALPLIEGLSQLSTLSLTLAAPSKIVGMLTRGEADLALASIADVARSTIPLTLVPVGMIGSPGATMTVRIFSRVPMREITMLHADTDSHTSVVLAQLLLRQMYTIMPTVAPLNAAAIKSNLLNNGSTQPETKPETKPEAMLLIGDKVVTNPPSLAEYPHVLDLGEAWHAWTNLPFMYACWMCRTESLSSPESNARIRLGADILDRQRRHNATRISWIARTRATSAGWPVELAEEYLSRTLSYEIDALERHAALRFLNEAHAQGFLPACTPAWLDTQQSAAPTVAPKTTASFTTPTISS